MYKFIFLDLDDTIWDFQQNAKDSLKEVYFNLNIDEQFDDFEHFYQIYARQNKLLWELYGKGKITKEYLKKHRFLYPLSQVGIDDEQIAQKMGDLFLETLPTKNALLPHAQELLDYLSGKYPLTIISNGFIEVQHKKIKNSGIDHYFEHVVLSEHAQALKPDKRIFEYALQMNNALAAEAIMIGDMYQADIIGAQNAGIDQIFLNRSEEIISEENKQATYEVKSLNEVFSIL